MKRFPTLRFSALALAALLAGAPAARSETPAPKFTAESPAIKGSEDLSWNVSLSVMNKLDVGLYLDSLSCEIEELGAPAPRRAWVSLDALVQSNATISAGEGVVFDYVGPVISERAKLTFHLRAHGASGTVYRLATLVTAEPSDYSVAHASELIPVRGKKVEIVVLAAEGAAERAPGLLLIHGEGGSARDLLHMGQSLSRGGFHVLLVSMPGSGQSEGPADLGGPATVAALESALDRLKSMPGVDPAKLAAWGISGGATAAASLAARRPDVAVTVAQSGLYDLWSGYRAAGAPGKSAIVAQAGRDSAAWRERSPFARAASVKGTVFVLHGEKDPVAPVSQARAFVAALQKAGVNAESKYFPAAAHSLPRGEVQRAVLAFLRQHFGS